MQCSAVIEKDEDAGDLPRPWAVLRVANTLGARTAREMPGATWCSSLGLTMVITTPLSVYHLVV